jgi:hypothetical protein
MENTYSKNSLAIPGNSIFIGHASNKIQLNASNPP